MLFCDAPLYTKEQSFSAIQTSVESKAINKRFLRENTRLQGVKKPRPYLLSFTSFKS